MTVQSGPNISAGELLLRLRKALALARLDFDDVMARCRSGHMQFHDVPGAVGITSISVSGPYRTCYCHAVAGTYASLPALERVIDEFARQANCQVLEADGRPGWRRAHKTLATGYAHSAVKFRKNLE